MHIAEPPRRHDTLSPVTGRWRWLGHPAFLACVALLALNDHVLKDRYPGWWTGKLSDFAGVAVVATLASVVLGPLRGVALAGVGFVALKAIPGVAEIASPVLGGLTSRDATDLIALVILVPLWFHLDRRAADGERDPDRQGSPFSQRIIQGVRAASSVALPVLGAIFAVATVTATSCYPDPAVTSVTDKGNSLFALVEEGYSPAFWARSRDGGRSWRPSSPASGAPSLPRVDRPYSSQNGPLEACGSDGTCWRIRSQRTIERSSPNGRWVQEFGLSDSEFSKISRGCTGGDAGVLGSIAVTSSKDDPRVVASLGAQGVVTRSGDGTWDRARVVSAPGVSADETFTSILATLLAPALTCVLLVLGKRWLPSWRVGMAAAVGGWALAYAIFIGVALTSKEVWEWPGLIGQFLTPVTVVAGLVALAIARRPRRINLRTLDSSPPWPPAEHQP